MQDIKYKLISKQIGRCKHVFKWRLYGVILVVVTVLANVNSVYGREK